MRAEVAAFATKLRDTEYSTKTKQTRCVLCPCRVFDRVSRALEHVQRYHVANRNYTALAGYRGGKQIKVAQALYDNDQITNSATGKYLARSASLLRRVVGRQCNSQEVWELIALVLDEGGPRYVLKRFLSIHS